MGAAMAGFAATVSEVESHQWGSPTPCPGWSVLDIVDHVVAGDRFTALTLEGLSLEAASERTEGVERDNPDVLAQIRSAADSALEAFEGSLDRIIAHRVGPVSARRVLGFRIIDQLGHTWDVATAAGLSSVLDRGALALGVELARSEQATLDRSPNFAAPPREAAPADDAQTTFLRMIGRAS